MGQTPPGHQGLQPQEIIMSLTCTYWQQRKGERLGERESRYQPYGTQSISITNSFDYWKLYLIILLESIETESVLGLRYKSLATQPRLLNRHPNW